MHYPKVNTITIVTSVGWYTSILARQGIQLILVLFPGAKSKIFKLNGDKQYKRTSYDMC